MKCRRILVFAGAWLLAGLARGSASADVIFDNFDAGGTFSPTNNLVAASASVFTTQTRVVRAAAQFTVSGGDFTLSSITLPISQQNNVEGDFLRVRLTTDAGDAPATTLEVLSDGQPWPQLTASFSTTTTLASSVHPHLSNGAKYWIVTELNQFPTLNSGEFVDYRWFDHVSMNGVTSRQQQTNGALPSDPWPGSTISTRIAFRVEGASTTAVGAPPGRDRTTLAVLGAPSSSVRIEFTLEGSERRHVELDLLDLAGRNVARLVNASMDAGTHVVRWDGHARTGDRAPAGVYLARLRAGDAVRSARLVRLQ